MKIDLKDRIKHCQTCTDQTMCAYGRRAGCRVNRGVHCLQNCDQSDCDNFQRCDRERRVFPLCPTTGRNIVSSETQAIPVWDEKEGAAESVV